jgi:hypothetical protein
MTPLYNAHSLMVNPNSSSKDTKKSDFTVSNDQVSSHQVLPLSLLLHKGGLSGSLDVKGIKWFKLATTTLLYRNVVVLIN